MSDPVDLKKQLADAIAAYKSALQNVENYMCCDEDVQNCMLF